jgi:hypothetical protein
MKNSIFIAITTFLCLFIFACAPYAFNEKKAGICNELNSQIIFSGGTSNIRKAEIGGVDQALAERTYEKKCAN